MPTVFRSQRFHRQTCCADRWVFSLCQSLCCIGRIALQLTTSRRRRHNERHNKQHQRDPKTNVDVEMLGERDGEEREEPMHDSDKENERATQQVPWLTFVLRKEEREGDVDVAKHTQDA
eukprot:CAMPEP_0175817178 /NCGR_PEP_ID=MMETSP0107_2-20121207/6878_1 /TAXON_ID=195067 ORGANISM="Goniomonas pacifica, Strain CCMP1869" /NCGR_SAMPLE_ID=MMETSP0107_2 /ASSEMBLY_ACC=CAM_ASM_000203 /LENGTH=118 /DNA_ID=CAMNT_0017129303 /DNA_START=585 /DNA_END=941 /DNA_ORIENTATION=-